MSQEILTQLDLLEEIAATAGYKSCRVLAEGTEDTFCLFVTVPTDQTAFDVAANMVDACWTVQDGVAIERKHHKDIAELVGVTKRRMVIGGYDIPVANLPYTLTSDAGNLMSKGEPFAAWCRA